MASLTAEKGRLAENAAADFLQAQGYQILCRNYLAPRLGELDLVARRDNCLAIIEVKARTNAAAFGGLPATITPGKIRRMRKAAWCYLKENQLMNIDVTFLAALVEIDCNGNILLMDIIPIESL